MDRYYPDISSLGPEFIIPLRVIAQQMLDDPLYLDRGECPYGAEEKAALAEAIGDWKRLAARDLATTAEAPIPLAEGADKWEALAQEAENLFVELRAAKPILTDDPKDKLSFYRTATQLLDKLVTLGERSEKLRQIDEFRGRVLAVFDQVLSPEQRTQATRILEGEGSVS